MEDPLSASHWTLSHLIGDRASSEEEMDSERLRDLPKDTQLGGTSDSER